MIISPSRNFIFIHLEKCGGTSVETALEPYLDWGDILLGSTDHGERQQALYFEKYGVDNVKQNMFWKHSIAPDICGHLGKESWDRFNKISVVRNPVDLMVSLYRFSQTAITFHIGKVNKQDWKKMIGTHVFPQVFPYTEKYVEAYVRSEIENNGFNGFVLHLLKKNYTFVYPQIERIRGYEDQKDMGLVIELTQLNDRWREVLNLAGIEDDVPLEFLNQSHGERNIDMSEKVYRLIKSHFALDYQELPKYTGVYW